MPKKIITLFMIVLLGSSVSILGQPADGKREAANKRRVLELGITQNVKLKLSSGENLTGRIAEMNPDFFVLQFVNLSGEVKKRDIPYGEIAKISKTTNHYLAKSFGQSFIKSAGAVAARIVSYFYYYAYCSGNSLKEREANHFFQKDSIMKWQSKFIYVLLFGGIALASAMPLSIQKNETQGDWVDPATGLMWAGKDNGQDVKWGKAKKYCRDLRLSGYADWRMATIEELEGIYDNNAEAPGLGAGKDGKAPSQWHVKGNLFLSGYQWSRTPILDDRERPSGLVWYFDFWNKYRGKDDSTFFGSGYNRRVLCVRNVRK